jgi:DNA-binding HxlR family transcriptional regulator
VPLRSDWSEERCPIARSLEVLGDPWVLLVLRRAFSGVRRFDQLRTELGIADNVLSNRLAKLVDAGLLRRVAYRDHQRTRYEYVLTDAGADTFPAITALAQWGERQRPIPTQGCGWTSSTGRAASGPGRPTCAASAVSDSRSSPPRGGGPGVLRTSWS